MCPAFRLDPGLLGMPELKARSKKCDKEAVWERSRGSEVQIAFASANSAVLVRVSGLGF